MARRTMTDRVQRARAEYESKRDALALALREAIAERLARAIPAGWYLTWNQSDQQYDDENYYFGLDGERLATVLRPRRGELLEPERPRKTAKQAQRWGYSTEMVDVVVDYGAPAKYAWHLDEDCRRRGKKSHDYDEPGVVVLDDYDSAEATCGLTEEQADEARDALKDINEDDLRAAFGDQASVRVDSDGTYEVL